MSHRLAFEIETPPSRSVLAAAALADIVEPVALTLKVSPSSYILGTLAAWDERQQPKEVCGPEEDTQPNTSVFTPKEECCLEGVIRQYIADSSTGAHLEKNDGQKTLQNHLLTELSGFAAIPRILAADNHVRQSDDMLAFLQKYGHGSEGENVLPSVIMTPAEMQATLPWQAAGSDIFSLNPVTRQRCASLLLDQIVELATNSADTRNNLQPISEGLHARLLGSPHYRSMISRSISDMIFSNKQEHSISEQSLIRQQAEEALAEQRSFLGQLLSTKKGQQLAEIMAAGQGEMAIAENVNLSRTIASEIVQFYVEATARLLFEAIYAGQAVQKQYPRFRPIGPLRVKRLNDTIAPNEKILSMRLRIDPTDNTQPGVARLTNGAASNYFIKLSLLIETCWPDDASTRGLAGKAILVTALPSSRQHVPLLTQTLRQPGELTFLDGQVVIPRRPKSFYKS